MNTSVQAEVERVERMVTAFIDDWTARTKRKHAVGDSLHQLEHILADDSAEYGSLADRLAELARWLERYGEAAVDPGVRKDELEIMVAATEKLVRMRERQSPQVGGDVRTRLDQLLEQLVLLIRRGTSELGLEYTPAGLMETPATVRRESERVRRSLLERLQGFEDVKAAYMRALEFQKERLEYFYQEDSHLLSVLDYQLKNLEARPNNDDEFFAACLLYYLSQHNYRIAPYLKRFQKAVEPHDALALWERRRP